MSSASLAADRRTGPIVFELDADFNISAVKPVGVASARQTPAHLHNLHFFSLIPPEARGAADEFFARLRVEEVCSSNQLFLQYPQHKSVPIDLLGRRIAAGGSRTWEVVVWNRERFSRTERELMLLYAVSSRINQSPDEFAFAEEVLFQIHNMMDVDASGLLYVQRGRLLLTASRGLSPASQELLQSLPGRQAALSLPLASGDPLSDMPQGLKGAADEICAQSGCNSWLVVPVRSARQFYGILAVARQAQEPFSERERHLLLSLGRNLASANERGRLFRGIKERNLKLSRSRRRLRDSLVRLERANRELQHLDEMKKSFITLASHELQTPLTSIIGNAELMQRDFANLPPRSRESLTELLGGVDDLRARIEALLAAHRVGSGFLAPRFSRCSIRRLLAELEPEVRGIAADRRLQLRSCRGAGCPDILLDTELVKQALRLQVDNALRHTAAGGEIGLDCAERSAQQMHRQLETLRCFYPDIEERLARFAEYVLITVADNGEGVADSEKLKIFTPFYGGGLEQHHSSRGFDYTGKGFGLGLSLAKRIIEAHSGLLWVEDRAGGGSCFCQLLPRMT